MAGLQARTEAISSEASMCPELPPHLLAERKRKQAENAGNEDAATSGAKRLTSPSEEDKRERVMGPVTPPIPCDERPRAPDTPVANEGLDMVHCSHLRWDQNVPSVKFNANNNHLLIKHGATVYKLGGPVRRAKFSETQVIDVIICDHFYCSQFMDLWKTKYSNKCNSMPFVHSFDIKLVGPELFTFDPTPKAYDFPSTKTSERRVRFQGVNGPTEVTVKVCDSLSCLVCSVAHDMRLVAHEMRLSAGPETHAPRIAPTNAYQVNGYAGGTSIAQPSRTRKRAEIIRSMFGCLKPPSHRYHLEQQSDLWSIQATYGGSRAIRDSQKHESGTGPHTSAQCQARNYGTGGTSVTDHSVGSEAGRKRKASEGPPSTDGGEKRESKARKTTDGWLGAALWHSCIEQRLLVSRAVVNTTFERVLGWYHGKEHENDKRKIISSTELDIPHGRL